MERDRLALRPAVLLPDVGDPHRRGAAPAVVDAMGVNAKVVQARIAYVANKDALGRLLEPDFSIAVAVPVLGVGGDCGTVDLLKMVRPTGGVGDRVAGVPGSFRWPGTRRFLPRAGPLLSPPPARECDWSFGPDRNRPAAGRGTSSARRACWHRKRSRSRGCSGRNGRLGGTPSDSCPAARTAATPERPGPRW